VVVPDPPDEEPPELEDPPLLELDELEVPELEELEPSPHAASASNGSVHPSKPNLRKYGRSTQSVAIMKVLLVVVAIPIDTVIAKNCG
jgi:hypothetical protein